jgi:ligand-binding sensor domain-containing protein
MDRRDPVTEKFTHFPHVQSDPDSLGGDAVNTIYQASDGALWVGTITGPLNRIDRQSLKISHLSQEERDPSGLNSPNATAILEGKDHNLWVATWGAGLYHLNPNGTLIRHYSQRDGLVNDTVFNISADERGLLWIATNDGISMFNPETGNFRNFDVNDGLPGNSFDALVTGPSSNGPIYFGGKDGLVMFSPEEIRDNPIVPLQARADV